LINVCSITKDSLDHKNKMPIDYVAPDNTGLLSLLY
jgi:hypothetical protein